MVVLAWAANLYFDWTGMWSTSRTGGGTTLSNILKYPSFKNKF